MRQTSYLAPIGTVVPPRRAQSDLWDGFFSEHYKGLRWAERAYNSAGVDWRHPAVDPCVEDVSSWGTGRRMQRYLVEATPLAKEAASNALAQADLGASDLGLLAVVSCTGYVTPGLDVSLVRDLGAGPGTERLLLGHMGCHAALPALGLLADHVASRGRPAMLTCVELPSLHVQVADGQVDQVLAHALFSDAAAAVVIIPEPSPGSLAILDLQAATDPSSAELITWEVTDMGFRMGLSRRVPEVLRAQVGPVVATMLGRHGLGVDDIGAWAVHPGGLRILTSVGEALSLQEKALSVSVNTLKDFGNCSSATVLMVLGQLQQKGAVKSGDFVVALAFGPGLTLYAVLLQGT